MINKEDEYIEYFQAKDKLIAKYGAKGYGLFMFLSVYAVEDLKLTEEEIKEMITFMHEIGLFKPE